MKKEGRNVDIKGSRGNTGLHIASKKGQESVVAFLLENDASINDTNENDSTPLHLSSQFGYVKVTEILLANGAKCDLEDLEGDTLISIIASANAEPLVWSHRQDQNGLINYLKIDPMAMQ